MLISDWSSDVGSSDLHIAAVEVFRDRAGGQQPRIDAEIVEPAVAEIDKPLRRDRQRVRSQPQLAVGLAFVERGIERDIELRRGDRERVASGNRWLIRVAPVRSRISKQNKKLQT